MSSREIAQLCEKRHDNVMQDFRAMLTELHSEGDLLKFEEIYTDQQNRTYPVFMVPKRETISLISQASPPAIPHLQHFSGRLSFQPITKTAKSAPMPATNCTSARAPRQGVCSLLSRPYTEMPSVLGASALLGLFAPARQHQHIRGNALLKFAAMCRNPNRCLDTV
jgi:hypothetical protein